MFIIITVRKNLFVVSNSRAALQEKVRKGLSSLANSAAQRDEWLSSLLPTRVLPFLLKIFFLPGKGVGIERNVDHVAKCAHLASPGSNFAEHVIMKT